MKFSIALLFLGFSSLLFAQSTDPSTTFSNYRVLEIDTEELQKSAVKSDFDIFSLQFDRWQLQLELVNLFSHQLKYSSKLQATQDQKPELPVPTRGYTNAGGRVSLTFAKDFIYGFIEEEGKTFFIEPLWYYDASAAKGQFIIYNSEDVMDNGPKTCGYKETLNKRTELENLEQEKVTGLCYEVEYGICADFSMFSKYGSVANVEAHVVGVTNNVNTNYNDEFDDELIFVISGIHTISTAGGDPWTASTNSNALLSSFSTWAVANLASPPLNISHDVASLWSNRDFDGNTIGLAYTPGVCSPSLKYNILQDFNNSAPLLRVLTAHELGHNLNATHDIGTNTFIMSPSVNNVNIWSANSINEVEAYYNSQSCLAICAGSTPQVNFSTGSSSIVEMGGSGFSGVCNEPYIDVSRTLELSIAPAANATVNISVDPASTATALQDFELLTTSVTFTPSGALSQEVTIRIFDDVIEELEETIILNITTSSTDISIGFVDMHTLTLDECGDIISATDCPTAGETTVGPFSFIGAYLFRGQSEDVRTRSLYTAAQLQAAGLTAGNIDQLSLYVFWKESTGPFQNFRIGMMNVADPNLSGVPFYATQEVFTGDVTTVDNDWNDFTFSNNFFWDGVSNLYIDYCFDNSSTIGSDTLALIPSGFAAPMFQFIGANGASGCSLSSGTLFSVNSVQPFIKFNQVGGTFIETDVNSTATGDIKAGETATFFSAGNRAICSIKNLGTTDMDCVEVTINTEGTGMPNLPFGADQYSDKTFQVEADHDAFYELTLYYTNEELATWTTGTPTLNIIQSSGVISAASTSNSSILNTLTYSDDVGAGDGDAFKTTTFGDGYFALSNATSNSLSTELDQADFIIEEFGAGVLLMNKAGDQYLVTADLSGTMTATLNNSATATQDFDNCNLVLSTAGKGLIFNGDAASPTLVNVDNDGAIYTSIIGSLPASKASLESGNIGFPAAGTGIKFKNSENECWKLVVENNGGLFMLPVACN